MAVVGWFVAVEASIIGVILSHLDQEQSDVDWISYTSIIEEEHTKARTKSNGICHAGDTVIAMGKPTST